MLRTTSCVLPLLLASCFSVGVHVQDFVVLAPNHDTAVVVRSRETMPFLGFVGAIPSAWPIEMVCDLCLPWYALAHDDLDVRWGPIGAALAQLPWITILPQAVYPPQRWFRQPLVWLPAEFEELLAAARRVEEQPGRLTEVWRRRVRESWISVLDVRLVEIRPATQQEQDYVADCVVPVD